MSQIAASVVFIGFLVAAAAYDVWKRRIPNRLNAACALSGVVAVMSGAAHTGVADAAQATAWVLAAGIVVQWLRLMGGGDVKLALAMAIWLGKASLTAWLVTAVAGGVVALFFVRRTRTTPSADGVSAGGGLSRLQLDDGPDLGRVPYGVALAIGGAWAWFSSNSLV